MKVLLAATAVAATGIAAAAGAAVPLPHSFEPLAFLPRVSAPYNFTLLAQTQDQRSAMFTIDLDADAAYSSVPPTLVLLEGTPYEVGQAYGTLLGKTTDFLFKTWVAEKFPKEIDLVVASALLDWLWDEGLSKHTPPELQDELRGIADKAGDVKDLVKKVTRIVTLANLPADTQNKERVILDLVLNGDDGASERLSRSCGAPCAGALEDPAAMAQVAARFLGAVARRSAKGSSASGAAAEAREHGPGMCDYFAVWGQHTEDGRLFSSRNLDFDRDISNATGKLVTVVRYSGADYVPYATFGTAGFWGALAGMSAAGITVSEANLDNSDVSFRGIAWPLRLRQILASAQSLDDARSIWAQAANTGAFNFLVGSAIDVNNTTPGGGAAKAAMALETTFKHTSEFHGQDLVEDSATFSCACELVSVDPPECVNGTTQDGVSCNWPFSNDTVSIGASLPEAVFRSNHGLHPATMATQEPLWNDTVMRCARRSRSFPWLSPLLRRCCCRCCFIVAVCLSLCCLSVVVVVVVVVVAAAAAAAVVAAATTTHGRCCVCQ
jgi:hypothetical protein